MSPSSPDERFAYARGAFVALHVFAVTAMAMPSAGSGLTRSAWADPTVQGEFQSWTTRLNGMGANLTVKQLEDKLWTIASGFESARETVLYPFMPYYTYCGTWQSWKMFVAPHRFPGRLEIDVDHGTGWEPLYVARSADHTWKRSWLDHDRTRAALFRYSWKHYRISRGEFTDWVARTLAKEDQAATRVRVSWQRYRTASPEEVLSGTRPTERRDLANTRDLREYR
jgi:hypothetical protein